MWRPVLPFLALVLGTLSCRAEPPVIGLYAVPAPACSLVAAAGFTVVHSYDFETHTPESPAAYIAAARSYLDTAARHGLRVVLGLPRAWITARDSSSIATVVRGLADHPALLVWYEDERAQSGDLAGVERLHAIIQTHDRARGLALEEGIAEPRLLDLGSRRMFTYYPVQEPQRARGRLYPVDQRLDVRGLRVPFWPVLQAFGQDLIEDEPAPRFLAPSAHELQYTLMSSLIAGASGVFFYTYLQATRFDTERYDRGAWAYTRYRPLPQVSPELWRAVLGRVREAHALLPLLDEAEPLAVERGGVPATIEMQRWNTAAGELVLLANPRATPAQVHLEARGHRTVRHLRGGRFDAKHHVEADFTLELPGPGGAALLLQ